MSFWSFLATNYVQVLRLTGEHLWLAAISTAIAATIGIPAGIFASHRPRWSKTVIGFANVVQTIPSLALFGFLIPLPLIGGIGARTAIIALVLYALLPIIKNTVTGILAVDPAVREAGIGMGMTDRQLLWRVEIPLSANVIFAGVRVAAVISIGIATIAAVIGAGGLGEFIFRGVAMVDHTLILAGALPAALLAILADSILGQIEKKLTPGART